MAKRRRQRSETAAKHDLIRLCAFVGILISAVLFVVGAILNACGLGNATGVFNFVAQLALLVAVAFPAWDFIKSKGKVWRIVYWVALVIYIFGCVFGLVTVYVAF